MNHLNTCSMFMIAASWRSQQREQKRAKESAKVTVTCTVIKLTVYRIGQKASI